MPKRPEPSFELKKIIWDVAATVGKDNPTDIQRQLDYELEKRRKKGKFFEQTPDVRTISRIIKEINELDPGVVVAKLPSHVWKLRDDYEAIKQLAEGKDQASQKKIDPLADKATENHVSELLTQVGSILNKHYDDLAKVAATLADNMDKILRLSRFFEESVGYAYSKKPYVGMHGNIIGGGFVGEALADGTVGRMTSAGDTFDDLQSVNILDAKCLLEHFNYRFPNMLRFKDWHEANEFNISRDVVDTLNIMTRSKNFGVSPTCPVCKDMLAH